MSSILRKSTSSPIYLPRTDKTISQRFSRHPLNIGDTSSTGSELRISPWVWVLRLFGGPLQRSAGQTAPGKWSGAAAAVPAAFPALCVRLPVIIGREVVGAATVSVSSEVPTAAVRAGQGRDHPDGHRRGVARVVYRPQMPAGWGCWWRLCTGVWFAWLAVVRFIRPVRIIAESLG